MRWLDGITDSMTEFEQTLGDSGGQRNLACCTPRGCKESDTTERLNNNRSQRQMLQAMTGLTTSMLRESANLTLKGRPGCFCPTLLNIRPEE